IPRDIRRVKYIVALLDISKCVNSLCKPAVGGIDQPFIIFNNVNAPLGRSSKKSRIILDFHTATWFDRKGQNRSWDAFQGVLQGAIIQLIDPHVGAGEEGVDLSGIETEIIHIN